MSYTYNRFKDTTIFGNFQNSDYPDASVQASATFDRNIILKGDIIDASGNYIYTKLSQLASYVLSSDLTTILSNYVLTSSLANYVLSSTLTSTLSNYVLSSTLTTTLASYSTLSSPTFTGTPSTTTPSSGTNNTTRIPTTAWVQSYFGNLASENIWTAINNFTGLQLNGIDITTLFMPLQPIQYLYSATTNMGAQTQLLNGSSIVVTGSGTYTLTLPRVNNTNNTNVGVQIKIINLSSNNLTVQTSNYNFQGLQTSNSFSISTGSMVKMIGYYNGQTLGYYWYVY